MNRCLHTLALSSIGLLVACSQGGTGQTGPHGTETDNPVVMNGSDSYTSPSDFKPPASPPPPCGPARDPQEPPGGLPSGLLLQLPDQRQALAQISAGGAEVWDLSDPLNPTRSSGGILPGGYELMPEGASSFWMTAMEQPLLNESEFPVAAELDAVLKLVKLDVSDPSSPVRSAEVTVTGDFWQVQRRGSELWVLTARRSAADRACDAPKNPCGGPSYETFELHGFRPNGDTLEPIADAELAYGDRIWWGTDGIVTVSGDGQLHVLRWDATGALVGQLNLPIPANDSAADAQFDDGPADVVGDQLLWVGYQTLYRFDLAGMEVSSLSTSELATAPTSTSRLSLFWDGRLWLNTQGSGGEAQLWGVGEGTPARVSLPNTFSWVLPLPGATLDGHPGVTIALGQLAGAVPAIEVLTLDGSNVSVIEELPPGLSPHNSIPAPPGLRGVGNAPAWKIAMRGAGLPLGIDPTIDPAPAQRVVRAFAGIPSASAELRAEATVIETDQEGMPRPSPQLEIRTETGTSSFELLPAYEQLLPIPNGLVVAATTSSCLHFDCSNFVPGVMVFDVSTTPRLVGSLPMPEPEGGTEQWSTLTLTTVPGTRPPAAPLVFVADVARSCHDQAECDALGIRAEPISSANPSGEASCSSEHDCAAQSGSIPIIFGQSHRQYAYALNIAVDGVPSWEVLGASALETTDRDPALSSSFGAPRAFGDTVAITRLERLSVSGEVLPAGQSRFMLDRFRTHGPAQSPPSVNVPGYPVAYLGTEDSAEYWVSVEPFADEIGRARLHRLRITAAGAESESRVELDGEFGGLWSVQVLGEVRGVVLGNPDNGCGVTRLNAFRFGGASRGELLEQTSSLDLPSDGWEVSSADGARILLRRGAIYALIELDDAGTLRLSALKGAPALSDLQLLGTTAYGHSAAGEAGLITFGVP